MVHCISLALVYPVCFTLFAYLNKKMAAINWRVVAAVAAADKLTKMAQSVGIDTPNYTPIVPPTHPSYSPPPCGVLCAGSCQHVATFTPPMTACRGNLNQQRRLTSLASGGRP